MLIYKSSHISIIFGNATYSLATEDILERQNLTWLDDIKNVLGAEQLIFPLQQHTVEGYYIADSENQDDLFTRIGDYVITKKKHCALGVVTADCLPIILHDPVTGLISVIHAGWKGLAQNIFQRVVKICTTEHAVDIQNLELYIGPAAGGCCYEILPNFKDYFLDYQDYFDLFFLKKNSTTYFDMKAFITLIARNLGIDAQKIYTKYYVCTICSSSYCSYRREKENARRQISMICLD